MTRNDYDEFVKTVAGFAELKGKTLSAPAIKLYWHAMRHWSIGDFRDAAAYLLRTSEFMPTPKDFEELRKASVPSQGEAWSRVLEHVKGKYRSGVGIDDGGPIDRAVMALGGYKTIAFYDEKYLGALERRFAEHYEATQSIADIRAKLPHLAGVPALTDARTSVLDPSHAR